MQNNQTKRSCLVAAIVLLLVLLDQAVKFYVKLNFHLGESVEIFSWWQISFVENDGMAFGIEWFDKFFLTLFRIVAVGLLGWYIHTLIEKRVRFGYVVVIAMVLAGALGNIVDCVLYGMIFSPSTYSSVATLVPWGSGYGSLFYGKVVDMLYFPLITDSAGETLFFRPVFNVADSAITVAVALIIIFFRKDLNETLQSKEKNEK